MKFYNLKVNRRINKEWRVILPPSEDNTLQVTNKLSSEEKLDLNRPINFGLINTESDRSLRNETPFQVDLIYWKDDIMLGASKPEGKVFAIVSSKLRKILEKYKLPSHVFYTTNIYCGETQTSSTDYYLLFIYDRIQNYTDYSKSEFTYIDWNTKEVIKKEYGTFESAEEYGKVSVNYFRNKDIRIYVTRKFLTVDYDIIWGIPNTLFVNEHIKKTIEASDIYGVKFTPIKNHEIVPVSEW